MERRPGADAAKRRVGATLVAVGLLWATACGAPVPEGGAAPDGATPAEAAAPTATAPGGDTGGHEHAAHGLPPAEAAGHSLYQLPTRWRDQTGRELAFADLAGRPQVVAMVYTYCSFACPRILADMKRIEAELAARGLADEVGFTIVSVDPERDTPERLARFAEGARLDPVRWTLLHGHDGDVRAMSVLLGVKYRALPDGEFEHSNVITVLDAGGVPVHRAEGLGVDVAPAVGILEDLTARAGPDGTGGSRP